MRRKDEERAAAKLAKAMAMICVRNTMLETSTLAVCRERSQEIIPTSSLWMRKATGFPGGRCPISTTTKCAT